MGNYCVDLLSIRLLGYNTAKTSEGRMTFSALNLNLVLQQFVFLFKFIFNLLFLRGRAGAVLLGFGCMRIFVDVSIVLSQAFTM